MDSEINDKIIITRGEAGGDNGRKMGNGFSGTSIKDTWTKPKWGRIKGGKWGWLGWEEMETTVFEKQ